MIGPDPLGLRGAGVSGRDGGAADGRPGGDAASGPGHDQGGGRQPGRDAPDPRRMARFEAQLAHAAGTAPGTDPAATGPVVPASIGTGHGNALAESGSAPMDAGPPRGLAGPAVDRVPQPGAKAGDGAGKVPPGGAAAGAVTDGQAPGQPPGRAAAAAAAASATAAQEPGQSAAPAAAAPPATAGPASALAAGTGPGRRRSAEEDSPNQIATQPMPSQSPAAEPRPAAPPPAAGAALAEAVALAERVATEVRAAQAALLGRIPAEGIALRIDLGRTMLGIETVTLALTGQVLTVRLTLAPGAVAHDLPQAVQALTQALARRHPGRDIRIEQEDGAPTQQLRKAGFDPLLPGGMRK